VPKIVLPDDQKKLIQKEWARIDKMSSKAIASVAQPTARELLRAHQLFFEREKRDVFYRAAMTLIPQVRKGQTSLSLGDVIAIVLQTWNASYYRYHRWDSGHFHEIERLLSQFESQLSITSTRDISSLTEGMQSDEGWIWVMFAAFKKTLGPVGAAKTLHLLAPRFFPLWDQAIAKKAYAVTLDEAGYIAMIRAVKFQLGKAGNALPTNFNFLKLIDEYNYCRYSKGWI
jgi:hypothetical protein